MKNIKKYIITIFITAGLFNAQSAYTQSETFEDVAFRAMQHQIDKNLANLKLDKLKSPYYISYMITDAYSYSVSSELGGIVEKYDAPFRSQVTTVMVGNHKRNNLNFIHENHLTGWYGSSFTIPMPIENSYEAISRTLWAKTDSVYKSVAEIMEAKLTAISQQNLPKEEVNLIDYFDVPVTNTILPSKRIIFDKAKIDSLAKELSVVFASYPGLTNSGAGIYIYDADALFLSSEKIKYKVPFSLISIYIYAETVAIDGEPLWDRISLYFKTPEQIPSAEILKKEVNRMASMLMQLRKAPSIYEPYIGPVMFEGQAVGELVAECFIDNPNGLLASRKPVFSSPAIQKRYSHYVPNENNIEQFIGRRIISKDLSVSTALHQKEYNKIPLIGYYELDAQGVVPEKNLKIIENGVLKTLLTDRTPTLRSEKSTGNSCFAMSGSGGLTDALSSGVIEVDTSDGKTYKELKGKLIAAAKEEGCEYAYIVRKMTGSIYIYRISVKDGREELMRSAEISDVAIKSFKRIIGATKEKQVYNTLLEGYSANGFSFRYSSVPASFIIPEAIVFEELEIDKAKNIVLEKEPIVPNPMKK